MCKMFGENVEKYPIPITLQRNTRTVKKATHDINYISKTGSDKGTTLISDRELRNVGRTSKNRPLLSIKQVFEQSG